jgi:hypothetical protein
VKDVMTKIKNLRTQFAREIKKSGKKSGSAGGTTAKWWLEDRLKFLVDYTTPKRTVSNLQVGMKACNVLNS